MPASILAILVSSAMVIAALLTSFQASIVCLSVFSHWFHFPDQLASFYDAIHAPFHDMSLIQNNMPFQWFALVTGLLTLLAGLITLLTIAIRKRWMPLILFLLLLLVFGAQLALGVISYVGKPSNGDTWKKLSSSWDNYTKEQRILYQKHHDCCGWSDESDRMEADLRFCYLGTTKPGCKYPMMQEEERRWFGFDLLMLLCPAILFLMLPGSYYLYKRYLKSERRLLRRRALGGRLRAPPYDYSLIDSDDDDEQWDNSPVHSDSYGRFIRRSKQ